MDRAGMGQIEWDAGCRVLMRAAREISRELGHHEIICPLHLLLSLLINVPPFLAFLEPDWPLVRAAMGEYAPPWGDLVVLSPGGQTPTTKRVLLRAMEFAEEAKGPVRLEHVWSALQECEGELVETVLRKLR